MPDNLSSKMKNWVAQSGSLNFFYDFEISSDQISNYTILNSYGDFYITLFCTAMESISDISNVDRNLLFNLSKGFELFSRKDNQGNFVGINTIDATLLAASLKYIAGFTPSSFLLAKRVKNIGVYPDSDAVEELAFILSFLLRDIDVVDNEYVAAVASFLDSGDDEIIKSLIDKLEDAINESLNCCPSKFFLCSFSKVLLEFFVENNIWNTLLSVDPSKELWEDFVNRNINNGIWSYFPSQVAAIDKGILNSRQTYALQMPTSAGKTSLCEAIIYYHIKTEYNAKVVLLAPFRSLASELKITMGRRLKPYGIKVKALYGGIVPTTVERESLEDADLIIATPEKMMAIEDVMPNLLSTISLVVCDEGHLLDDKSRGLDYELFLTRLKVARGEDVRFIYLSAIVPNISEINSWLGGGDESCVSASYRPTSVDVAFLLKQGRDKFRLDVNPHLQRPDRYDVYNFLVKENYQYINPETRRTNTYKISSQKQQTVACALKSLPAGAVAIFCPTKGKRLGVGGHCLEIIEQINLKKDFDVDVNIPSDYANSVFIESLKEYLSAVFSEEYLLVKCVENSFVYHHGSLPQYVREIIEDSVRNNHVSLVVCTNTLAEGVNLPLRTLVINSTTRYYDNEYHNISNRDLKNLIGRVGRAGKELSGLTIVIREADQISIKHAITDHSLEPVKGRLFQVVVSIDRALRRHRTELTNDLLERQTESFLELVDSIDSAIIDLVNEGLNFDDVNEIVLQLVANTFSYSQLDEDQRVTMNTLFSLRAAKLREDFDHDHFLKMKRSGTNFRLYKAIIENIDFDDRVWAETNSYDDIQWIDYIFKSVADVSNMEEKTHTFLANQDLDYADVKNICLSWIRGQSYGQISESTNLDIDCILDIIHSLLGYNFSMYASSIVRIKEQSSPETDPLPDFFNQWISCLQHGFSTITHYYLLQLGFAERIGMLSLGATYIDLYGEPASEGDVRSNLVNNFDELVEHLSGSIPQIALDELSNSYEYLVRNLW